MGWVTFLSVAALGVVTAGLLADETRKAGKSGDETFSDKMFVEKAAVGGMFEVKSSQLAQQMATNPNVKAFAGRMVADHTKANQELMALHVRRVGICLRRWTRSTWTWSISWANLRVSNSTRPTPKSRSKPMTRRSLAIREGRR